ncbi:periplasmic folding chaperone [Holospora obtusa F1]|uniref:Periplasmic folding chaperone n=1 Tax=Holospora obtusa F1 TaxID=1399147 RepID=W6TE76_HOLOB|nr:peptidylprolyl isomerase [Holospora obtusa]ETZ06949.1 periplasmic folding chaperone [Holospora obtusa F1]
MFESKKSPFVVGLFVLLAFALSMGSPFVKFSQIWDRPVISVGKTKIYEQEFRKLFAQKMRMLSILKSSGALPSTVLGHETQYILEDLLKDIALKEELRTLGFQVSDRYIKQLITKYPEFQDGKGKFSERKFRETLKSLSLGLKEFLDLEKDRISKQRLQQTLMLQFLTPSILEHGIDKAVGQRRKIRWKKYDPSSIQNVTPPTLEELKTFYHKKEKFKAPLSKRVTVLKVSSLKKNAREMVQVEEELSAGNSLEEIGKKLNLYCTTVSVQRLKDVDKIISNNSPLSFKKMTYDKINLLNPKSDPEIVQNAQEAYVIQVQRIEPERLLSFEEAKPLLRVSWLKMAKRNLAKKQALKDKNKEKVKKMQHAYVTWLAPNKDIPEIIWNTAFKISLHEFRVIEKKDGIWLLYLEEIEEMYKTPEQLEETHRLLKEEWKIKAWYSYTQGLLKQYQIEIDTNRIENILQNQKGR